MALHSGRKPRDRSGRHAGNTVAAAANPVLAREVVPPVHGLPDDPVPPDVAYRLIHDELMLDGNARLNLATFVTTWMEPRSWP